MPSRITVLGAAAGAAAPFTAPFTAAATGLVRACGCCFEKNDISLSPWGQRATRPSCGPSRPSDRCPAAASALLILVMDLRSLHRRRTAGLERTWAGERKSVL